VGFDERFDLCLELLGLAVDRADPRDLLACDPDTLAGAELA
jgi:hypothetical protein